jgi:dTDP-4-dehydrorhamnose 3,5-epimerase-like enzyme
MRFQLPPMDHLNMVCCYGGEAIDSVVDLKERSLKYGQFALFKLTATKANSIYTLKVMAHCFCVKSQQYKLVYKVTTVNPPYSDAEIHWNSFGISWQTDNLTFSERGQEFPKFNEFLSPYYYE